MSVYYPIKKINVIRYEYVNYIQFAQTDKKNESFSNLPTNNIFGDTGI